jgi:hypothetical protein
MLATQTNQPLTVRDALAHLSFVNRAYQVLYALGDSSATVRTLEPSEAFALVALVADVRDGQRLTALDDLLAAKLSPRMISYVASGL